MSDAAEKIALAIASVGADIILDLIAGGTTPHGEQGPYVNPNDRRTVREIIYGTGDTLKSEDAGERAKASQARKAKKTAG